MRILIHSAPPWAPSGYGLQCRFLAQSLQSLGHEVGISAFGGVHENTMWNGIPIMSCGGKSYGNDVISGNYKKFRADALFTLGDLWVMDANQFQGLNVYSWVPIDCYPLGVMDKQWIERVSSITQFHPVAMSQFGQRQLAEAGFQAPIVPHATTFKPSMGKRIKWRVNRRIPEEMFVVGKVGVNNEDDRKAFSATMQAFALFSKDKHDVGLYLHTEAQARKGPNLAYMALDLGLAGKEGSKVAFADEYLRATDQYDQEWMESMYNGIDILDTVTKGEGFGCPAIDALACGTPIIGGQNSATEEKIKVDYGWLVKGQPEWAIHHHAWWQTPYVGDLASTYEKAYRRAKSMRKAAEKAGANWSLAAMETALKEALA